MSKKKQDLVDHAESLFYNYGIHAIGLKRIVTEANVALMTMYNHFESKEDLVLEVLKQREERYFDLLRSHVKTSDNQALSIAQAHSEWLQSSRQNGCMFLRAKEEYSDPAHPINTYVVAHKEALLAFVKKENFNHEDAMRLVLLLEGATSLAEVVDVDEVATQLQSMVTTTIGE
ncbi:TetR/AcrR family transcriptional regulator [Geomicrobium sp. JCM 19055]|uniref:TetR/AcrR family transcriptional regulator n=1 Tax=Geomicrobium sp. JCM 19055 TaxID=1460649 RepID=UPI00045EDC7D|nr:TetR/AcrR family transcriptional regulator [Geomicrobium sp. JCM 19055]GAJ99946.1 transcriptional regulator, TetR family [Geomicrobium sp. JCM 19055]